MKDYYLHFLYIYIILSKATNNKYNVAWKKENIYYKVQDSFHAKLLAKITHIPNSQYTHTHTKRDKKKFVVENMGVEL